ncbi:hypothetical protein PPERSA_08826 [Pseudocohnilembus persalinus]|uniref:Uncharacterized protein n=1 Tax=Pseudocohnilembus persalinus TaxID=266149 RepID=A0A0V0R3N0_PSEPJ|nr:hypothetical protein PPERSA_08826 [Pseudocohnilembus persalinus]|eukprot:KRX09110.1 hypothetical protein PPERSA_08826 [Pseudocohnilembus persalinus]
MLRGISYKESENIIKLMGDINENLLKIEDNTYKILQFSEKDQIYNGENYNILGVQIVEEESDFQIQQFDNLNLHKNWTQIQQEEKKIQKKKKREKLIEFVQILTFIQEIAALGDLFSDIFLLVKLMQSNKPGWATTLTICLLSPYLIMYAPIVTYLFQINAFKGLNGSENDIEFYDRFNIEQLENEYKEQKQIINYDEISLNLCCGYKNKFDYLFQNMTFQKLSKQIIDLPKQEKYQNIKFQLKLTKNLNHIKLHDFLYFLQNACLKNKIQYNFQKMNMLQILLNDNSSKLHNQFSVQFIYDNVLKVIKNYDILGSFLLFILVGFLEKETKNHFKLPEILAQFKYVLYQIEYIKHKKIDYQIFSNIPLIQEKIKNSEKKIFTLNFKELGNSDLKLMQQLLLNFKNLTLKFINTESVSISKRKLIFVEDEQQKNEQKLFYYKESTNVDNILINLVKLLDFIIKKRPLNKIIIEMGLEFFSLEEIQLYFSQLKQIGKEDITQQYAYFENILVIKQQTGYIEIQDCRCEKDYQIFTFYVDYILQQAYLKDIKLYLNEENINYLLLRFEIIQEQIKNQKLNKNISYLQEQYKQFQQFFSQISVLNIVKQDQKYEDPDFTIFDKIRAVQFIKYYRQSVTQLLQQIFLTFEFQNVTIKINDNEFEVQKGKIQKIQIGQKKQQENNLTFMSQEQMHEKKKKKQDPSLKVYNKYQQYVDKNIKQLESECLNKGYDILIFCLENFKVQENLKIEIYLQCDFEFVENTVFDTIKL